MDKIYFYQYNQKYIKMYNKYIWGHLGKVYKVIIYNAIFFINISGPLFLNWFKNISENVLLPKVFSNLLEEFLFNNLHGVHSGLNAFSRSLC